MFAVRLLLGALLVAARATACKPGPCICFGATFRCVQGSLETVPEIPENTTVLDLRFNKIRRIPDGVFSKLKHLNTIMLNANQIQILQNGVFKGLSSLKYLYLYKNKISEIEHKAFEGMPILSHLYLHYNKIERLDPHLFDPLPRLERLFLHENKIQHIQHGTFNKLHALKRLRLDGNALVCDCELLWFKKLISENMQHTQVAATCQSPGYMQGKSVNETAMQEFTCKEPRILEHPHDVEVTFGGTAVFSCRVDGDPQPKVTWMLNSNEIDVSDPKYSVRSDGSLVIASMTDSDVGVYECMAKSPYGEAKSKGAKILYGRSSVKPQFRRRPEDQIASEGDTIQLECSLFGVPLPQVTWTRDDIPLIGERDRISPEGTLTIKRVTIEDTGAYKCIAESANGRVTAQAQVTVNVRPRMLVPPENKSVRSGTTTEMRCYASGAPSPVIAWFKDGDSLQPSERIQFLEEGSILRIKHVKEEDSGLYTCLAQNSEGTSEASGELRVKNEGPRPPKLVLTPYPLVAPLGASVELPCKAQGDPKPVLTWTKDGRPLHLDSYHKMFPVGSLRIYNITRRDSGLYQCKAENTNGEITAQATLTIEGTGTDSDIDENLVIQAVEEAQLAVDRAVNSTLQSFLTKKSHSPHSLMRLLRYPDPATRAFVRPADIYEKTLLNIRRHITSGIQFNETEEFSYEAVLTKEQLELIARLSGCMEHQFKANCSDMCYHTKYRTVDGTCNNFQHQYWGASFTGFRRILNPIYENGFSSPVGWNKHIKYHGYPKPAARLVSTSLIKTETITDDEEITHLVMQWGQFLDHDIDHAIPSTSAESWEGIDCKKSCDYSPPCFPMEVPHGDTRIRNRRCMDFIRSSAVCGSGTTSVFFEKLQPREQINQLTAFIDGSQVYGFTENRSVLLRDYSNNLGLMRTGILTRLGKPLLPIAGSQEVDCRRDPTESDIGCFLAGDIRVNEQVALIAMHTVWLREHNRIALELKGINPHWSGDTLFNEARKIVGAEMQHITFEHWLPHILGLRGMKMLRKYDGYDPNLDPGIANVFATAALRFGHSLINPVLRRLNSNFETIPEGDLTLGKAFFAPWRLVKEGGVDPLMRGMFMSPAKRKQPQENLNSELTEHLFTAAHAVALDLAAMNIQRSRDHGLPGYNEYRKYCNMSSAETFDDLSSEISDQEVRYKLQDLYGHPGNIDVWVGGILEDQIEGARVGPLFRCLLVEQFKRVRDGDRFWYESPSTFSPSQLTQIKQSSLARVLCDNGDNITQITSNVFILPNLQANLVKCEDIPVVDLRFWYDCEDCENSVTTRERRGLEGESIEERVDGLEEMVNELQRTVRSLRRRVKQLSSEGKGCKDHKGKIKHDGDTWQKDSCTLCECQLTSVVCTRLQCAPLNCERKIKREGRCCPECAVISK